MPPLYLKWYKNDSFVISETKGKRIYTHQEELDYKVSVCLRLIREMEKGKTLMQMQKVNQVLDLFGQSLPLI